MPFTIEPGVSPSTPVTYEWLQAYEESQAADAAAQALDATLAQVYPATALTTAGSSVSDATTNTALVTVPAANILATAVAGSVFYMRAAGILASPASGEPT